MQIDTIFVRDGMIHTFPKLVSECTVKSGRNVGQPSRALRHMSMMIEQAHALLLFIMVIILKVHDLS